MMSRMLEKLRSIAGETLVESLVSMLIITMVFAFLVTAIVTATKVNDSVKAEDVSIDLSHATSAGKVNVTIGTYSEQRQLYVLKDGDEGKYYYYEASSS